MRTQHKTEVHNTEDNYHVLRSLRHQLPNILPNEVNPTTNTLLTIRAYDQRCTPPCLADENGRHRMTRTKINNVTERKPEQLSKARQLEGKVSRWLLRASYGQR